MSAAALRSSSRATALPSARQPLTLPKLWSGSKMHLQFLQGIIGFDDEDDEEEEEDDGEEGTPRLAHPLTFAHQPL